MSAGFAFKFSPSTWTDIAYDRQWSIQDRPKNIGLTHRHNQAIWLVKHSHTKTTFQVNVPLQQLNRWNNKLMYCTPVCQSHTLAWKCFSTTRTAAKRHVVHLLNNRKLHLIVQNLNGIGAPSFAMSRASLTWSVQTNPTYNAITAR